MLKYACKADYDGLTCTSRLLLYRIVFTWQDSRDLARYEWPTPPIGVVLADSMVALYEGRVPITKRGAVFACAAHLPAVLRDVNALRTDDSGVSVAAVMGCGRCGGVGDGVEIEKTGQTLRRGTTPEGHVWYAWECETCQGSGCVERTLPETGEADDRRDDTSQDQRSAAPTTDHGSA